MAFKRATAFVNRVLHHSNNKKDGRSTTPSSSAAVGSDGSNQQESFVDVQLDQQIDYDVRDLSFNHTYNDYADKDIDNFMRIHYGFASRGDSPVEPATPSSVLSDSTSSIHGEDGKRKSKMMRKAMKLRREQTKNEEKENKKKTKKKKFIRSRSSTRVVEEVPIRPNKASQTPRAEAVPEEGRRLRKIFGLNRKKKQQQVVERVEEEIREVEEEERRQPALVREMAQVIVAAFGGGEAARSDDVVEDEVVDIQKEEGKEEEEAQKQQQHQQLTRSKEEKKKEVEEEEIPENFIDPLQEAEVARFMAEENREIAKNRNRKMTQRMLEKEWVKLDPRARSDRVINQTYNEVFANVAVVFQTRKDYWDLMTPDQRNLLQDLERECWSLQERAERIKFRGWSTNEEIGDIQREIWTLKCDVLVHFGPLWKWGSEFDVEVATSSTALEEALDGGSVVGELVNGQFDDQRPPSLLTSTGTVSTICDDGGYYDFDETESNDSWLTSYATPNPTPQFHRRVVY